VSGAQPLPGAESEVSLAERRVMRTIGTESYVPILGIRRSELWLVLYLVIGGGALGGVLNDLTGLSVLFQIGVAVGLLLSVTLITASPTGMGTTKWLRIAIRYALRPKVVYAASAAASDSERNEGGVLNFTPFTPDDRTQDYTGVKEAYPGASAVMRDDYQMEAFVEVVPDNMDFATEEEWRAKQQIAKRFANHSQKGELKFHATTREFDLDRVVERLEERSVQRDIQARPVMRALVDEYRTRKPQEMREQGVQQVSFYLGVTVDEHDVEDTYQDEPTPIEKLSRLTVLGALFSPFVERAADLPEEERQARMIDELDNRIQTLRNELTQKVPGWTDRRLSTVEMLTLNARYWNGDNEETYDALERIVGGGPAIRSRPRNTPDFPSETEQRAGSEKDTINDIGGPFEGSAGAKDEAEAREYQMAERRDGDGNGESPSRSSLLGATIASLTGGLPAVPLTLPGPRIGPPLTPQAYNAIFGWLPEASSVSAPTSAPVVGILMYVVGLLAIGGLINGMRETEEEAEERGFSVGDLLAEERRHQSAEGGDIGSEVGPAAAAPGEGATVDELGEQQNRIMAANAIEEDTRSPQIGEQYVKTLFVKDTEDIPADGFLSPLFETTDIEFDLTAYAIPKFQPTAVEDLRAYADDLTVDAEDEDSAREGYLAQQAQKARLTHQAAENGTRVMDLGVYITIRGDSREAVEEADQRVRSILSDEPANVVPGTVIGKQDLAVQSAAPLGPDALGESDPDFYRHVGLAGGVGALLVSATNPTLFEENGIEMGIHKRTRAPIIADPFARENGYGRFIIAQQGSGKSYDGKVTLTRLLRDRNDVRGVVLEPMGNWVGVSAAMEASEDPEVTAERIVIGGTTDLNPLELHPITPQDARDLGRDYDPLSARIESAMSFCDNYLAGLGFTDSQIARRRVRLQNAILDAFASRGIDGPADVIVPEGETPDWEPPTMIDVLDQLEHRVDAPGEYVTRSEEEAEAIKEQAKWLLDKFGPFEDGQYANLGRHSEFAIGDADLIYLDLGQAEGDLGLKAVLTMQLLVTKVYEEAKETDDKLVLAMDEFRYILQHATNLDFMGTLFRHHRHYDISPWIITQTVNEFLDHPDPEAKALLESCTMQQFHKLPEMDRNIAETFDMNGAMARFVAQEASAGSDGDAFSDTLLGIAGEWRRAEFRATPAEHRVAEWDPRKHYPTELPGITEANAHLVRDPEPLYMTTEEKAEQEAVAAGEEAASGGRSNSAEPQRRAGGSPAAEAPGQPDGAAATNGHHQPESSPAEPTDTTEAAPELGETDPRPVDTSATRAVRRVGNEASNDDSTGADEQASVDPDLSSGFGEAFVGGGPDSEEPDSGEAPPESPEAEGENAAPERAPDAESTDEGVESGPIDAGGTHEDPEAPLYDDQPDPDEQPEDSGTEATADAADDGDTAPHPDTDD
jgi:hypothetical protein